MKKILISDIVFLILAILGLSVWFFVFNKEIHINIIGNNKEVIEVFSNYEDKGANACYKSIFGKCRKIDKINISNLVDTTKLGTYTITYETSYGQKHAKIVRTVEVVDKTEPVITSEDKINLCPNAGIDNINFEYKSIDNYDGDITNNVYKEITKSKITLQSKDSSNNISVKEIPIEYNDTELPIIKLSGNKTIYILKGTQYKESGIQAIDNCDGDITSRVKTNNSVDTSKNGTYKVVYTVSDNSGNETSINRTVIVTDSFKTIYLTFDDGPGPYTNKLLDILNKYNVKATFFVTNPKGYASSLIRAYKEGHSIGLHTYSHVYKSIYSSEDAYFDDLNMIKDKIYQLTGLNSSIIRFPGGSSNTVSSSNKGIMSRLTKKVEELGYSYFDWNVASGDTSSISSDAIANNVIKSLNNRNTYIVLQHDIKIKSVNAVPKIIEYGLSHGYRFDKLTADTPVVHHPVAN